MNTARVAALESSSLDSKRHNYNFIETKDINNIHYTYEKNNQTYHVYEKLEDNYSKIETKIYISDRKNSRRIYYVYNN